MLLILFYPILPPQMQMNLLEGGGGGYRNNFG
jgi:hypothetical protein